MMKRPTIGLTMRLDPENGRFYLGRDYSEAVFAAGGNPVHLALIPEREYIFAAVESLDGILLPGSDTDVDPEYYDEEPHPKIGQIIPEKDLVDRMALEAAEQFGLPILAICFGMQALNVWRGGSLIQDIESSVSNCIKHEQGNPRDRNSHRIKITDGSLLSRLGTAGGTRDSGTRVKVNSHHHQCIKRVGKDLRAVAHAADGVIEAVEAVEGQFIMGVQWHPELSWKCDPLSCSIFEEFVEKCRVPREPLSTVSVEEIPCG